MISGTVFDFIQLNMQVLLCEFTFYGILCYQELAFKIQTKLYLYVVYIFYINSKCSNYVSLINVRYCYFLRYLEISVYINQFEVDEELLENALKKFLILPPIFLTDLQTLIVVLKLLNFALTKSMYIYNKIKSCNPND